MWINIHFLQISYQFGTNSSIIKDIQVYSRRDNSKNILIEGPTSFESMQFILSSLSLLPPRVVIPLQFIVLDGA